jgi:hypothetical protein
MKIATELALGDSQYLLVSGDEDGEVRLSIWIKHAQLTVFLTKDQSAQLMAAIATASEVA